MKKQKRQWLIKLIVNRLIVGETFVVYYVVFL